MALKQPDLDFANALQAAGLGTVGTDIRVGEPLDPTEPGAEGVNIWVWTVGGPRPIPEMGRDGSGKITASWDATVFVRIRGLGDAYDAPQAVARTVLVTMTFNPPAGYYDLWADFSEPEFLGLLPSGQSQWQVVFSMKWRGKNGT